MVAASRCDSLCLTFAARVLLASAPRSLECRHPCDRELALRRDSRALRGLGRGISFGSYAEFEVVLDLMVHDADLRSLLAERGRRYVESNFRWPVIIDRYDRFAGRVLERIARTHR